MIVLVLVADVTVLQRDQDQARHRHWLGISIYFGSAALVRGTVSAADCRRNADRSQSTIWLWKNNYFLKPRKRIRILSANSYKVFDLKLKLLLKLLLDF